MASKPKQVQVFGRKRHAVAVAVATEGRGLIRLNGQPLHLVEPAILRVKVMEPVLLLGRDRFAAVDIRMRVTGGGHSSQVYAVRQALAKALVSYTQKCKWTASSGARESGMPKPRCCVRVSALCVCVESPSHCCDVCQFLKFEITSYT